MFPFRSKIIINLKYLIESLDYLAANYIVMQFVEKRMIGEDPATSVVERSQSATAKPT